MKLTLVPRLPAGQAGQDKHPELGLIYGCIILFILVGVYLVSKLSVLTDCDAIAPLNLTKIFACPLKTYTGVPCLTCGMTRSFVLLVHLEIAQAFLMNPVVFLTIVLLLLWGIYTLATRLLKTGRIVVKLSSTERKIAVLLFISALLTNWLYLILDGR